MTGFIKKICFLFLSIIGLTACATRTDYAPVSDVNTIEALPKNGIYHVTTGETLYSIAWRYGMDYRDLAERNHLSPPYHIQNGQLIYLRKNAPIKEIKPVTPLTVTKPNKPVAHTPAAFKKKPLPRVEHEPNAVVTFWAWPARGPVIGNFSSSNKGINIGGNVGDPIFATAAGKVVYSGHGLRGYGNLIIIKHNSKFLSAYAHNKKLRVHEGEWVQRGQQIAEMGNTGARRTQLHFEIRRNGQPINPLIYLTRKV